MQMLREFITQGFIIMRVGEKHLNGMSRSWNRGGHSTGSFARGSASSALGLTAVSLLPAYYTPVGTGRHAPRRISARMHPTRGVKANG